MDVKAGCYYRQEDGRIVKVLHEKVSYFRSPESRYVVYRIRQDGWPTPAELMLYSLFIETHEGPLGWDVTLKEFK